MLLFALWYHSWTENMKKFEIILLQAWYLVLEKKQEHFIEYTYSINLVITKIQLKKKGVSTSANHNSWEPYTHQLSRGPYSISSYLGPDDSVQHASMYNVPLQCWSIRRPISVGPLWRNIYGETFFPSWGSASVTIDLIANTGCARYAWNEVHAGLDSAIKARLACTSFNR